MLNVFVNIKCNDFECIIATAERRRGRPRKTFAPGVDEEDSVPQEQPEAVEATEQITVPAAEDLALNDDGQMDPTSSAAEGLLELSNTGRSIW